MHLQKVQNRKLSALKGLGVVAGIFAALVVLTLLTQVLSALVSELAGSVIFWVGGIAIALWTMRRFILTYTYALGTNMIRIAYAYGRYERVMVDLYFNNILNAGTLDEMRDRYPSARVNRATRPACDLEPLAVAARDNGATAIFLLQPDSVIREALEEVAKKNRK